MLLTFYFREQVTPILFNLQGRDHPMPFVIRERYFPREAVLLEYVCTHYLNPQP